MIQTGMSRATFFNLRKQLKADGQLMAPDKATFSNLRVQGQPPVRPNIDEEVAKAQREDADRSNAEGPRDGGDGDQLADESVREAKPPDDDVRGWIGRQLAAALRRGDAERVLKLRNMLNRMNDDRSES